MEEAFLNLGHYTCSQLLDNVLNNLFLHNYNYGWTTSDNNGDGIVDNLYSIDDPSHSYDIKPVTTINGITSMYPFSNTNESNYITVTTTVSNKVVLAVIAFIVLAVIAFITV